MAKARYIANLEFVSSCINTRQRLELVLGPYKRNSFIEDFSINVLNPGISSIKTKLVITSKNSEKASKTLDYICRNIGYYSGFNYMLVSKQLSKEYYYKTYVNPRTGERQFYYVK